MKKYMILLALGAVFMLTGCIPCSINQFYSEDNLTFDPNIIGSWGENDTETTFIEQVDSFTYRISLEDETGRAAFEGHLFKINGVLFLDLFPDADELQMNETYKEHLIPVHSVYRVIKTEPDLVIDTYDYGWLVDTMEKQPPPLDFIETNGRMFFTSPTEKLQEFIANNLDTQGAFLGDPMVLHRIRP